MNTNVVQGVDARHKADPAPKLAKAAKAALLAASPTTALERAIQAAEAFLPTERKLRAAHGKAEADYYGLKRTAGDDAPGLDELSDAVEAADEPWQKALRKCEVLARAILETPVTNLQEAHAKLMAYRRLAKLEGGCFDFLEDTQPALEAAERDIAFLAGQPFTPPPTVTEAADLLAMLEAKRRLNIGLNDPPEGISDEQGMAEAQVVFDMEDELLSLPLTSTRVAAVNLLVMLDQTEEERDIDKDRLREIAAYLLGSSEPPPNATTEAWEAVVAKRSAAIAEADRLAKAHDVIRAKVVEQCPVPAILKPFLDGPAAVWIEDAICDRRRPFPERADLYAAWEAFRTHRRAVEGELGDDEANEAWEVADDARVAAHAEMMQTASPSLAAFVAKLTAHLEESNETAGETLTAYLARALTGDGWNERQLVLLYQDALALAGDERLERFVTPFDPEPFVLAFQELPGHMISGGGQLSYQEPAAFEAGQPPGSLMWAELTDWQKDAVRAYLKRNADRFPVLGQWTASTWIEAYRHAGGTLVLQADGAIWTGSPVPAPPAIFRLRSALDADRALKDAVHALIEERGR